MSSDWPLIPLGELAELVRGVSYKPADLIGADHPGGIPLLRATNIGTKSLELSEVLHVPERLVKETQKLRDKDVVIAMSSGSRAAVGRLAQLRKEWKGTFGAFCGVIRPLSGTIDSTFLGYVLYGPEFRARIDTFATGTAIMNLSRENLLGYLVKVPPRGIQKKISGLLGSIDDRITLLRETNTTLEAIAQALFKSWFVDFDPVHAKIQGRAPEGMDEATAALFPDSFEDSELGPVPKGWSVASIYEVAKVIYGAPFASKQFKSDPPGKPLVRIRDLKDERPGVYTEEIHPKGYLLQPGDITVGMDGEFRAYVWGGEEAWLNQRVCVFQPVNGANSVFVRLSIAPLLAAVEASETATTVIHLGKNDIDRFKICHPGDLVLDAFASLTTPVYQRIVSNKQMIQNLAGLRDTLLPRLISGQLRVSEALEPIQ